MDTIQQEKIGARETRIDESENTVDALDILLVLARRRWAIVITTAVFCLFGAILCLVLKPNFTATAIILPPQQQSSSSGLLSQLGSLASLSGGSAALGLKTPADMYVGILESRSIADNLITKFHLQAVYKDKKLQDARKSLKSHTEIEAGKDSLIHISVTDHDAGRASDLANAYVDQLYDINSRLAISEAAQRRVFFDQQLDAEKKALTSAEDDLRETQQKTGLIQLSGQAQVIIQTIAQLRARIASNEVELQSVRLSSTDQNPNVIRLQEEISTMRAQLSKLENDQHRQEQPGDIAVPAGRVPQDSLEYARKYREVKYHETLFDLLSRQYEAARIDEAKSAPIIQVIDHAVPPDKRSGPKRALILAGSFLAGFICSCVWAIFMQGLNAMRGRPETAARLAKVHDVLRGMT